MLSGWKVPGRPKKEEGREGRGKRRERGERKGKERRRRKMNLFRH